MNKRNATTDKYQKLYASLRFERSGLFKFIQETYHPSQVLYPGCSIHLTPAFYFPHVIFVDHDPAAMEFFSDQQTVRELVDRQRQYRRSPYIQFIYQDFTQPLPLLPNQFDLLLGLFVRGAGTACLPYLQAGGLYLTNNHQGDARDAFQDSRLSLVAVVQTRRGKYQPVEFNPDEPFQAGRQARRSKRYLRQTGSGDEYIENESYYVFRRVK